VTIKEHDVLTYPQRREVHALSSFRDAPNGKRPHPRADTHRKQPDLHRIFSSTRQLTKNEE
jgi:hypothetical protein